MPLVRAAQMEVSYGRSEWLANHSFIEVDRVAKPRIQGNFECFHVAFALVNNPRQFCDLPVDLSLITFQAFHRAVIWKVNEGLANLVAVDGNQTT